MITALPPKARVIIYYVTAGLGLVLGCIQVWYAASADVAPDWFDGAWAVFGFLAGGFGLTAASHVVINPPPADRSQPEAGGDTVLGNLET